MRNNHHHSSGCVGVIRFWFLQSLVVVCAWWRGRSLLRPAGRPWFLPRGFASGSAGGSPAGSAGLVRFLRLLRAGSGSRTPALVVPSHAVRRWLLLALPLFIRPRRGDRCGVCGCVAFKNVRVVQVDGFS